MDLSNGLPTPPDVVNVNVELTVNNRRLRATVPAPAGPVSPTRLLPVLQSLADTLVRLSIGQAAATNGQRLSCKAGCGACCRQLVPVSRTESHRLAEVVSEMPEPRQSVIRKRFADGTRRFAEANLLDALRQTETVRKDDVRSMGAAYFSVGVACPFLEEEACSIYPDRPLVCREFLVSSDPELCKTRQRPV